MHDVACEFARAAVRSKDAQKQLARTSLILHIAPIQEVIYLELFLDIVPSSSANRITTRVP